MVSSNYKVYLQFLAAEYNVLYLGCESIQEYDDISSYFISSIKRALNQNELEHIALTIFKHKINLVIVNIDEYDTLAIEFYKAIQMYSEDIPLMLVFDPTDHKELFDIVPLVDIIVKSPIDEDIFYKRLFTLLSSSYALKSIARREIVLKHENINEDALDEFFDRYEGYSLFIADDLSDIISALNSGDLSDELFEQISEKLDKIAEIFSKTEQTASISPIYQELSSFIKKLDITKIKPENLNSFNYLSQILTDVNIYLLDMFVDRLFKDVYIFKDSLQNNIEFFENKLLGKEELVSELEFF